MWFSIRFFFCTRKFSLRVSFNPVLPGSCDQPSCKQYRRKTINFEIVSTDFERRDNFKTINCYRQGRKMHLHHCHRHRHCNGYWANSMTFLHLKIHTKAKAKRSLKSLAFVLQTSDKQNCEKLLSNFSIWKVWTSFKRFCSLYHIPMLNLLREKKKMPDPTNFSDVIVESKRCTSNEKVNSLKFVYWNWNLSWTHELRLFYLFTLKNILFTETNEFRPLFLCVCVHPISFVFIAFHSHVLSEQSNHW